MARTRSEKWLTFEEANEFVRSQQIQSRQQFLDWWDENKPKRLSRYPQRVYAKEWKGWNEFLGTENEFNKTRRNWRSYEEAIVWTHKLGLSGGKPAWLEWVAANDANLPEDIPRRPDIVYKKDWLGWKQWLGDGVLEKVEAHQQAKSAAIYYVIKEREYSNVANVYTVGVEPGGVSALRDRWKQEQFAVIKMFEFNSEKSPQIEQVVNRMSHSYFDARDVRAVPNIHDLCWELLNFMDVIQ